MKFLHNMVQREMRVRANVRMQPGARYWLSLGVYVELPSKGHWRVSVCTFVCIWTIERGMARV